MQGQHHITSRWGSYIFLLGVNGGVGLVLGGVRSKNLDNFSSNSRAYRLHYITMKGGSYLSNIQSFIKGVEPWGLHINP